MGFLEKLKNVADAVSEKKKKAELAKYAKDAPVQKLPIIGFVKEFAGVKASGVQLCLDGENELVYMRSKAEKGPYEYASIGSGYDIGSFTGLRYTNSEARKMSNMTMYIDYFELISLTSNIIRFSLMTTSRNTDSDEIPQLDKYEKKTRLNLIYPFINVIADYKTKDWINEFCQRNELLPLFDEDGEVLAENMEKNAELVFGE